MTLELHFILYQFISILRFTHLPALCQDSEKGAVHAIMGMLSSSVKPWHCAAAELIGRLIINPDNEPFLLPVIPQVNVFWNLDHSLYLAVVFTVVLLWYADGFE